MDYIDSSAFAKYFSNEVTEKGAEKVKDLIENAIRCECAFISSAKETLSEFAKSIKKLTESNSLILIDANISSATGYGQI